MSISPTVLMTHIEGHKIRGMKTVMMYRGDDFDGITNFIHPVGFLFRIYYWYKHSKRIKHYAKIYYPVDLMYDFVDTVEHYGLFCVNKYNKRYDALYSIVLFEEADKTAMILMA